MTVAAPRHRRLLLQACLYGSLTRQLFGDAGIGPGMRVLDVGSGTGDVALLVAELVGERGSVVGVELDEGRARFAQERASDAGHVNVDIRAGDACADDLGGGFDAVVGRFVLRELGGAAPALARFAELAPGGVLAFQEKILTIPVRSFPPLPALERAVAVMDKTRRRAGVELETGVQLPTAFRAAGLPEPTLRVEAPIGVGPDWPGFEYLAESLREMVALARLFGVRGAAGIDCDDLQRQLRAEAAAERSVVVLTPCVGAFAVCNPLGSRGEVAR